MEARQATLFGRQEIAVDATVPLERTHLDATSWVDVARGWLLGADSLLDLLVDTVPWRRSRRWMYDRMVDEPRLTRWYRPGTALPHPALAAIGDALAGAYGVALGGPGLNYYRDGRDSVALHGDRELRRLEDTIVAIVTLGAARPFHLRRAGGGPSIDLAPASGDLLVMGGRCQADWLHGVPKTAHASARVSVSYRWSPGWSPRPWTPAAIERAQ